MVFYSLNLLILLVVVLAAGVVWDLRHISHKHFKMSFVATGCQPVSPSFLGH